MIANRSPWDAGDANGVLGASRSDGATAEKTLSPTVVGGSAVIFTTRLLHGLNQVRTDHGLRPVVFSPALAHAAYEHAISMVTRGYFAHASADGTPFDRRIAKYYPRGDFRLWSVGENLLWASPSVSPERAVSMWMASPPHRENILTAGWQGIGIAAVHVESAPRFYRGLAVTVVVTDFGARS